MKSTPKGAGLQTPTASYQLDHLAVICIIMDIPLLCLDDTDLELAAKYYPGVKAQKVEYSEFTPEALVTNYDVLFTSDLSQTLPKQFQVLEKLHHKKLRHVFCPHGFSDKVFYFKCCAKEDIVLVYGQNMLDLFNAENILQTINSYVLVGNYRYAFYKKNKKFYDDLAEKEVWSRFAKDKKTILYAPTWSDKENSGTFFEATSILIDQLPSHYNLLVKLHPRLELDDITGYYQLIGKYEHRGDVLFLNQYPPVYPILARSDIYVGDMSSVGYDYLAFNRPMFFLSKMQRDSKTERSNYLSRCGVSVRPDQYPDIYKMIESHLEEDQTPLHEIRQEAYKYTFAEGISFSSIRESIILATKNKS